MEHPTLSRKPMKRNEKRKLEFERSAALNSVKVGVDGHDTEVKQVSDQVSKKIKHEAADEHSRKSAATTSTTSTTATFLPGNNKERVIKPSSLWNFTVDYNDHFETPPIAYKDLSPVLEALSACLCKSSSELNIYDPYWCEGSMVSHMRDLGYEKVINRNRDFYADIKKKNIPEYDILVTNPPYSGEHKVNLLKFLATHTSRVNHKSMSKSETSSPKNENSTSIDSKEALCTDAADSVKHKVDTHCTDESTGTSTLPFALLLPVYTATKSYWKDFAQTQALAGKNAFYILPPDYYEYSHPEGTGKDIPPFYSAWFLGGFSNEQRSSIIQSLRTKPRTSIPAKPTVPPLKRLSFTTLTVAESIETLVSRGVVTDSKRPNPKQRQKMKQKGK